MDIASLISSFSTGTYSVTRIARGSITRGRIAAGTTSTVSITASVSPSTGADLKRMKEGRDYTQAYTVITSTLLYIGGQGVAYEADTISIGGVSFQVAHIETWTDPTSAGVGYRCIAVVV